MIRRHKWSMLSLAISIGTNAALSSYTQYQYRVYHVTHFSDWLRMGALSVPISVAVGIIAAAKEKDSTIPAIAITLGVFSIAFYAV